MPLGLGTIIGGAVGGLGSLFGGGGQQTVTTMPDSQTQQIRDSIFQQGQGIQSNPLYTGMLGAYGGFSPLTQLGVGALSGNQQAFGQFMNPYLQNVLRQSNQQFDQLGQKALNLVNDQATQAGAFGGSRAAVAQGVAAGQIANQQALANAQLLYGGFNDAQQRAQQAAQLGIAGNQAALGALGFPTSIYAQGLPGAGSTTTYSQSGGGLGGFLTGALGGGIVGKQLFPQAAAPASSGGGYTAPAYQPGGIGFGPTPSLFK